MTLAPGTIQVSPTNGSVTRSSPGKPDLDTDSLDAPFAVTSPYHGSWLSQVYGTHFRNLYGAKLIRERDFREKLQILGERPEMIFMGNFIVERAGIVALCREHGINVIHCEDGFFPHYGNAHGDPLGFSWESSLPRMIFRQCSEHQREQATACRDGWLNFSPESLPHRIQKPFVFWPLQLIGDKVNHWDLNDSNPHFDWW